MKELDCHEGPHRFQMKWQKGLKQHRAIRDPSLAIPWLPRFTIAVALPPESFLVSRHDRLLRNPSYSLKIASPLARMQVANDELFRIGNAYEIIHRESVSAFDRLKVCSHLAATKGKGCCKDERTGEPLVQLSSTVSRLEWFNTLLGSNICSDIRFHVTILLHSCRGCYIFSSLTFSISFGAGVFVETKEDSDFLHEFLKIVRISYFLTKGYIQGN